MSAVHVPPVTERKRISQKAINDVVRQIAEKFHPQKIILFGSYARGKQRPESDVDLLVYTPAVLAERVRLGDSFPREIIRDGKVVYSIAL